MKRYITTDKHPELKEGIVLFKHPHNSELYTTEKNTCFYNETVDFWASRGYIKELQEPKWTDQDMIDFLMFCYNKIPSHTFDYRKEFKNWTQQRS